ncbi:MAG: 3-oxoacyl-(acyl-carrier-protein) reductase [Bacteroidetes bacterium]|nr:3-oxoacyl-(acyl-carrier-protein) reductase [Bacteroidota bacterium]
MKNFNQKIIVITGAGSGMGRYMAIRLAAEGATVLLSDINEEGLNETKSMIEEGKGLCKTYKVDVGDKEQVYAFAASVIAEFKYIDVLINNAGMSIGEATLNEIPLADFEKLINVNMWGVIHHTKAFLDVMLTRPEAAIVNTSSVFGLMGIPSQIPYCVSKFAVRGFTDSLRLELKGTNVAVTCVHPGGIDTNIVSNGIHYKDKEATVAQFKRVVITSADKAAAIIISAIQKKSKRVMVGPDAKLIRFMTQLSPNTVDRVILKRKADFDRKKALNKTT